jgi:hypothetical protein
LWKPLLQAMPHAPALHVEVPLIGIEQTFAHEPQLSVSLCKLTQFEPHRSGVPPVQFVTQAKLAPCMPHSIPLGQVLEHEPQCVLVERSVSQPSDARPLQLSQLLAHANMHAPATHVGLAPM